MKTHVTVIPSDGIIAVDGEVLYLESIREESFHALQWHDGAGHVEPGHGLPNEALAAGDYAGRVAPFVALWEEEKERLEAGARRPATEEGPAAQALAAARAQSSAILMARMQTDLVQTGAFAASEFATFAQAGLFTTWAAGQTYARGYRLVHRGIVYEVLQDVLPGCRPYTVRCPWRRKAATARPTARGRRHPPATVPPPPASPGHHAHSPAQFHRRRGLAHPGRPL